MEKKIAALPLPILLLYLGAGFGVLYIFIKILLPQDPSGFVFRIIWAAGKLWATGQDPYGPLFIDAYRASGPGMEALWYYPPYWYPIAAPLGHLPSSVAAFFWKSFNFFLLIAASHLIARALADTSRSRYWSVVSGILAYACFMQATATTLFNGQTSIVVYFGFAALIFGLIKRYSLSIVAGLVFLALKPQFGVVAFLAIAAIPRYWRALFSAGLICILATTPILVSGNYSVEIQEFLSNLVLYSSKEENGVADKTGIIQIVAYLFAVSIDPAFFIATAAIVAFVILYFSSFSYDSTPKNTDGEVACLAFLLSSILFILPLTSYDMVSLAAVVIVVFLPPMTGTWFVFFGLIMCVRAGNLSGVLRLANPASKHMPESLLVSISLFLILVGVSAIYVVRRPAICQEQ